MISLYKFVLAAVLRYLFLVILIPFGAGVTLASIINGRKNGRVWWKKWMLIAIFLDCFDKDFLTPEHWDNDRNITT